jgi:hypothetical protein
MILFTDLSISVKTTLNVALDCRRHIQVKHGQLYVNGTEQIRLGNDSTTIGLKHDGSAINQYRFEQLGI